MSHMDTVGTAGCTYIERNISGTCQNCNLKKQCKTALNMAGPEPHRILLPPNLPGIGECWVIEDRPTSLGLAPNPPTYHKHAHAQGTCGVRGKRRMYARPEEALIYLPCVEHMGGMPGWVPYLSKKSGSLAFNNDFELQVWRPRRESTMLQRQLRASSDLSRSPRCRLAVPCLCTASHHAMLPLQAT